MQVGGVFSGEQRLETMRHPASQDLAVVLLLQRQASCLTPAILDGTLVLLEGGLLDEIDVNNHCSLSRACYALQSNVLSP